MLTEKSRGNIPAFAVLDKDGNLVKEIYFNQNQDEKGEHGNVACFNPKDMGKYSKCNTMILPNTKAGQRDVIIVAGKSGSGKSSFAASFADLYDQIWENRGEHRKIYVFSKLKEDPSIDWLNNQPCRVIIDDDLPDRGIDVSDFTNSLVIFDDVDKISSKKVLDEIKRIFEDCVEIGRHHGISVVYCTHLMSNYGKTRKILSEANYVVGFNIRSDRIFRDTLIKYVGIDKKDVEILKKYYYFSRWIAVHNDFPTFFVHSNGWTTEETLMNSCITNFKRF